MSTEALQKIIKDVEDAAYHRGWNDCFKAIMTAMKTAGEYTPKMPRLQVSQVTPSKPKQLTNNNSESGTFTERTFAYVSQHPGQTGIEIIRGLQSSDPSVLEKRIRTALGRLKKSGKLVNKKQKWYVQ